MGLFKETYEAVLQKGLCDTSNIQDEATYVRQLM